MLGFVAEEQGVHSPPRTLKIHNRLYKICRDISTHEDENHIRNAFLVGALMNPSHAWEQRLCACVHAHLAEEYLEIAQRVRVFCAGVDRVYAECVASIRGRDRYAEFGIAASQWQFAPLLIALWYVFIFVMLCSLKSY